MPNQSRTSDEYLSKFNPEAAIMYARTKGLNYPKKPKSAKTLKDFIEDEIDESGRNTGGYCEDCHSKAREDDMYCWFCGDDMSEDGTGGFTSSGWNPFDENGSGTKNSDVKQDKKLTVKNPEKKPEKKEPKKKPEKKPEKKSEKKESEKKESEPEQISLPVDESSDVEQSVVKSLAFYTKEINDHANFSGVNAWMVGLRYLEVKENLVYRESYESMKDYIESDITISLANCREYSRMTSLMSKPDAEKLGTSKMREIIRCPPLYRKELLEEAKPIESGGKGKTYKEVNQLRNQYQEKNNKNKALSNRGRKKEPNKLIKIFDLIGETYEIAVDRDGQGTLQIPETHAKFVIKVYKSKVKIELVESIIDSDDQE